MICRRDFIELDTLSIGSWEYHEISGCIKTH